METQEVIRMLSYYRHDIMNHLQIIQGYLDMDKFDRARVKLTDYTEELHQERRLINLDMPKFALWVMQFNPAHTNIRLSYHIHTSKKMPRSSVSDEQLVEALKILFDTLKTKMNMETLYESDLKVLESKTDSSCIIRVTVEGSFSDTNELEYKLHQSLPSVIVHKEDVRLICIITLESDE